MLPNHPIETAPKERPSSVGSESVESRPPFGVLSLEAVPLKIGILMGHADGTWGYEMARNSWILMVFNGIDHGLMGLIIRDSMGLIMGYTLW